MNYGQKFSLQNFKQKVGKTRNYMPWSSNNKGSLTLIELTLCQYCLSDQEKPIKLSCLCLLQSCLTKAYLLQHLLGTRQVQVKSSWVRNAAFARTRDKEAKVSNFFSLKFIPRELACIQSQSQVSVRFTEDRRKMKKLLEINFVCCRFLRFSHKYTKRREKEETHFGLFQFPRLTKAGKFSTFLKASFDSKRPTSLHKATLQNGLSTSYLSTYLPTYEHFLISEMH